MTCPDIFDRDISIISSLSSRTNSNQDLENMIEDNDNFILSDSDDEDELFESDNSENSSIIIDNDSTNIDMMLSDISQDVIDEVDEIHNMDYQHLYSEKVNGNYYIGICTEFMQNDCLHLPTNSIYLLVNSISSNTYFKWSHNSCLRYLYYYGLTPMHKPKIDILKLHVLNDGTYSVVIKTFWLKIIQRKWKKIFKVRKEILSSRLQLSSMHHREIHGNWPISLRVIPGLVGLLCY